MAMNQGTNNPYPYPNTYPEPPTEYDPSSLNEEFSKDSGRKKLNFLQQILAIKSPMCNHRDSCNIHQLKRTGKTVLICWGLRVV